MRSARQIDVDRQTTVGRAGKMLGGGDRVCYELTFRDVELIIIACFRLPPLPTQKETDFVNRHIRWMIPFTINYM